MARAYLRAKRVQAKLQHPKVAGFAQKRRIALKQGKEFLKKNWPKIFEKIEKLKVGKREQAWELFEKMVLDGVSPRKAAEFALQDLKERKMIQEEFEDMEQFDYLY